ncbi:LuxR C-terminal-related transcriptional regulator [Nannocystis radixulma]|uniref:LuxR C-terminal-related transcriptional regulator n=1 Tax=Nannocystis radixulma TaxID=2995305 RepID=A0ABT5B1E5_9BACT|nr:LuxR C-terminal-related transcriptional regulator [Nannocystis radixulma]MDC0667920.1 LuxR C-terminal-related transcriptional regulator [Nannocystis radixulma]
MRRVAVVWETTDRRVRGDPTTRRPNPRSRASVSPATRSVLAVCCGSLTGAVFELSGAATVVGRGPGVDLVIPDRGVSRKHVKLLRGIDHNFMAVDLGSTNGTRVNDVPVELVALRHGDRIGLGPDVVLSFEAADSPELQRVVAQAQARQAVAGLSERELEVARLVAQGLTNQAIATRLEIRPRTVASHLEHVYTRLDIHSRAELARRMAEADLLEP